MRMYAGYSVIIVLSTGFNLYMTKVLFVGYYVAWVLTLLWTGVVNYFILKKLWSFGDEQAQQQNIYRSAYKKDQVCDLVEDDHGGV